MRRFVERLLNLLRVRRLDGELGREIDAHLALMQEAYEARGMTPHEARRAALVTMGGVEQAKELHRQARSFVWLEDARQDVILGLRLLRRNPLFTITAAASLAIGIGANTAIFSVANGLVFRPPSGITAPDELIDIGAARGDGGLNPISYSTYVEIGRRSTSLSGVVAQSLSPHVMSLLPSDTGIVERVVGQYASVNFFKVLGSHAARGRVFDTNDRRTAVLDYDYWRRRFHSNETVVGQVLRINGRAFTVVGVAEARFHGTGVHDRDIWLAMGPGDGASSVVVTGRVRQDTTIDVASAEVAAIGGAINLERGEWQRPQRLSALPFSPAGGNRNIVIGFAAFLMVLVSMVLAAACSNVAGMLLTRSTARAREIAVRTALGASRGRLVRQLLTETVVLYLIGGVLGLVFARVLLSLVSLLPALPTPVTVPLALDGRVMLFALSLSLCAALVSGVLPAFKGSKADPGGTLKEGVRSSSRSRLRGAFVCAQVALSILLVVLAALFVRVLRHAGGSDTGFDSRGVEIASVDLSMSVAAQSDPQILWRNTIDRVRELPAVEMASLARVPPGGLEGIGMGGIAAGDGPGEPEFSPGWNIVESGYFTTLRIPVLRGRDFTAVDTIGSPSVVIVSDAIVRRLWPGQDAVGKPLILVVFNATSRRMERRVATVVGIVGDIKSTSLVDGLAEPYVYLPLAQALNTGMLTEMSIVARRRGNSSLESQVGAVVRDLDPALVLVRTEPLSEAMALGLAPQRVLAAVAAAMGLVSLLLASMGIYGVTAYAVALRRREFAIRLALGAPRGRVIAMVIRQGMWLVAAGASIGLGLAVGAGRVLAVFFYGLPAVHGPTLFGSALLLAAIGTAASVVPAVHAVRGDWRRALQEE
jgi:putative ABC transport system permease protein